MASIRWHKSCVSRESPSPSLPAEHRHRSGQLTATATFLLPRHEYSLANALSPLTNLTNAHQTTAKKYQRRAGRLPCHPWPPPTSLAPLSSTCNVPKTLTTHPVNHRDLELECKHPPCQHPRCQRAAAHVHGLLPEARGRRGHRPAVAQQIPQPYRQRQAQPFQRRVPPAGCNL